MAAAIQALRQGAAIPAAHADVPCTRHTKVPCAHLAQQLLGDHLLLDGAQRQPLAGQVAEAPVPEPGGTGREGEQAIGL